MERGPESGMTRKELGIIATGLVLATAAFGAHGIRPQKADDKTTCDSLAKGEPLTDRDFTFSPTINLFNPIKEGTFLCDDTMAAELAACRTTHDIQASVACAAASINKTVQAGGTIPKTLETEAKKTKAACQPNNF